MMRVTCVMLAVWLCASTAQAQGPAQQGPVSLSLSLQRSDAAIKTNLILILAADKLPETDYGFKPSAMPEVRTYGQLFGHVANAQFNACSAARAVPNPNMGINNEQKTITAEIVKALADSFAHCDSAFAALTEENGAQVMTQGRGHVARSAILAGLVAHSNEMYGTAAVYCGQRTSCRRRPKVLSSHSAAAAPAGEGTSYTQTRRSKGKGQRSKLRPGQNLPLEF